MITGVSSSGLSSTYRSQMQQKLFSKLDTNGDGKVDKSEMEAAMSQSTSQIGSGSSTSSRSTSNADKLFGYMDSDNSGSIDQTEFNNAMTKLSKKMESSMQAQGGKMPPPPGGMTPMNSTATDTSAIFMQSGNFTPPPDVASMLNNLSVEVGSTTDSTSTTSMSSTSSTTLSSSTAATTSATSSTSLDKIFNQKLLTYSLLAQAGQSGSNDLSSLMQKVFSNTYA